MANKYTLENLKKFTRENKVILTRNYDSEKITKKTIIEGKCNTKKCKGFFVKNFRTLLRGNLPNCKDCAKLKSDEKRRKTNIAKYNADNPMKVKAIKEKALKTQMIQCFNLELLNKFTKDNSIILTEDYTDVKNINRETIIKGKCITKNCKACFSRTFRVLFERHLPYCKKCVIKEDQRRATEKLLEQYKDKTQPDSIAFHAKMEKNKIKGRFTHAIRTKESIEKQQKKCLEQHGVKHFSQREEVKKKRENTLKERYNVKSAFHLPDHREKTTKTNMIRYKTEFPSQCEEVKRKTAETNIKRHGFANPMHNPKIADKCVKSNYRTKNYKLPSGKIIKLQGYENYTLDDLLEFYKEEEITCGAINVPKIKWVSNDGKSHIHYVDFFIEKEKRCIEIKSPWTFKIMKDIIFKKQEAGKKLGYTYEVWIYDRIRWNRITKVELSTLIF